MTLKDQILSAAMQQKNRTQPAKAWGVDAFIRVMSGKERDQFEAETYQDGRRKYENFRATLLVKTLADEQGNRLFSEADIASLSDFDSVELDRLFDLSTALNGMTKKDVDDLTKNS